MHPGTVVCHLSFNHGAYDDRIYWKELVALQEAGYSCIHITAGDRDEDFFSEEGIRIIVIRRKKKSRHPIVNRLLQVVFIKGTTIEAMLEKAKEVKACVYQYHDLQLNAITLRLKKLAWQPKVIYDAHEAYHVQLLESKPKGTFLQLLYRRYVQWITAWEIRAARNCDHIFVTDPYSLQFFQKSVPHVPVQLLYNYSFFSPQHQQHGLKEFDLVYTGLMSGSRGIMEMLQAVALLRKTIPDVRLLLIGPFQNDEIREQANAAIRKLELKKNVFIHGPVAFREMDQFYRKSKIGLGLFHPTPKYSTFIPIKLFEYMAFGLPVVFSNHGPSAEIIQNSDCGLLVPPTDISAIAHAIQKLLQDTVLYEHHSKQATEAIRRDYNWDKEKEKLLKVYRELLLNI